MRRGVWNRIGALSGHLGTVPITAALALPPSAVLGWVAGFRDTLTYEVLGWASVRVFGVLLCVSAVSGLIGGIAARAWHRVAFAAAVGLALLWGLQAHRGHFAGELCLGVGEPSAPYRAVSAGSAAVPPDLRLGLSEVRGEPDSRCTVLFDGVPQTLRPGEILRAGRAAVEVLDVHPAPLFFLQDADGKRTVEGYLKLGAVPSGPSYFQFELLPHRFYLTVPPTTEADPGGVARVPAEKLHLMVTRGKLTLLRKEVKAGERVPVDAFYAGFEPGTGWALLRVRALPPLWPLAVASSALALSVLIGYFRRGRT